MSELKKPGVKRYLLQMHKGLWPVLAGMCSIGFLVLPSQPPKAWRFADVSETAGVTARTVSGTAEKKFLIETMGGGICVLDYDQDGRPDLYFVNGLSRPGGGPDDRSDYLYRNSGDGHFQEVAAQAGLAGLHWGMGCVAADFDEDGDTDLYVTNYGLNQLFRNRGDGSFEEVAAQAGVNLPGWSTGAAFGDYDRDGDLDLYVANYVEFDFENPGGDPRFCSYRGVTVACGPRGLPGAYDNLFRNEGDGRFTDVSEPAGIRAGGKLYGFQPVWTDFDLDGDLDVFVANDSTPNHLWQNNGDGTFTDVALLSGVAYNQEGRAQANMGVDIADVDGDGQLDIYSTNFSDDYNVLYRSSGGAYLQDITFRARLAQITFRFLGFGTLFADFDNDGRLDIFAANGHIYPEVEKHGLGSTYRQPNQLFRNLGNGEFEEVGSQLGPGMALVKSTRGAVLLDYDADGDLDLALSNMDERADLLRNELEPRPNHLQIRLRGRQSNRDGIGARVEVTTGGRRQLQELHAGSSFLGNSQPVLHFGLGTAEKIDTLTVTWPSGRVQTFTGVDPNRSLVIDETEGFEGVTSEDSQAQN